MLKLRITFAFVMVCVKEWGFYQGAKKRKKDKNLRVWCLFLGFTGVLVGCVRGVGDLEG